MSIIQQHTSASLSDAWRTVDVDALDEDKAFDARTLVPAGSVPETSESDVRALSAAVRQLMRGGDAEGALRSCLERPAYEGFAPEQARDAMLAVVVEVLQGIKASEMSPLLESIYRSQGGGELLDVLMKYLYKGMASTAPTSGSGSAPRTPTRAMSAQPTGGFSQIGSRPGGPGGESAGAAMSVLLSWHEKVVDVAGLGCIGRVMTDWRRV